MRKRLLWALKLVITLTLIYLILLQVEFDAFVETVRGMDLRYPIAAWFLIFAGILVSALKWQRLLMVHEVYYGYWRLLKWYLSAAFIGNFLPSTIGGDSYRIYKTMKNPRSKASAVLAVFVERVTGLLAMVLIGYVAAIVVYMRDGHPLGYGFAMLGTIGLVSGAVMLAAVMFGKVGRRLLGMRFVPGAIKSFVEHAGEYKGHPGQLIWTMVISFAFHGFRFTGFWLILQGFGVGIGMDQITLATTIMTLVALIPISLNGWGLQEGSMLYLLTQFGVPSEVALALPLIVRVNVTSYGLMGGAVYFFDTDGVRDAPRTKEDADEVDDKEATAVASEAASGEPASMKPQSPLTLKPEAE